ncbi:hypothetical protein ACIBF1_06455 [Spirillospora sp. NPDC050679]
MGQKNFADLAQLAKLFRSQHVAELAPPSSPTLKQFLDTLGPVWQQGLLADKVYSGFTSAGTGHGGHESTLLALTNSFQHFGGVIVPPGYTHPDKFADGNPYGTTHFDQGGTAPVGDVTRNAARVQAERVVRFARAVRNA